VPAGIAIRLLGCLELAAQPQELALPIQRQTRRRVLGLHETLGREPRLLERL
jgi:hypothetical protein